MSANPVTDAPYRRALVVANPVSGQGQGVKAAREVEEGLRRRGVSAELLVTQARGDAYEKLRAQGTHFDLVVAAGGDGTLREVLEGLVDPDVPVAPLPFGTANVLAHEIGMPRDVHRFLEILLAKKTEALDVMKVNGRLSFLVTGIGLDGEIVRRVDENRSGPISRKTYVWPAIKTLFGFRPGKLSITLDGEPLDGTYGQCLVSNTLRYAGLFRVARDCRRDDGVFELVLFPKGSRVEIAMALARGLVGQIAGGSVTCRRGRSVTIDCAEPVPYQVDGDFGGTTPVVIEPAPNRYRLVVP